MDGLRAQREEKVSGEVTASYDVGLVVRDGWIHIVFSEPRGNGDSIYRVLADSESFVVLAQAMMRTNANEAIRAFGAALEAGIPGPLPPGTYQWGPSDARRGDVDARHAV